MAKRRMLPLLFLSVLITSSHGTLGAKEQPKPINWQPINPADLALKDNPAQPGAAAMILYRETETDDSQGYEIQYYRIKIFKEEGKKYADIVIPFEKGNGQRLDVEARTIHPDGKIIDFDGQVFEKVVAKHKGVEYLAKTFTLPDVQVGSIIEYKVGTKWEPIFSDVFQNPWAAEIIHNLGTRRATRWTLEQELFTRRAHFSFMSSAVGRLDYTWVGLPDNKKPYLSDEGSVILDVENIPAFEKEEYMPPEDTMKGHVDFFYVFDIPKGADTKTSDWFWTGLAKKRGKGVDSFVEKHKAVDRLVNETISENDQPDAKLRKLYERAQQIHNLSFEREKTEKEVKREKIKDSSNIDDVLKHGYGSGFEINALFAAMARAAGFDAFLIQVATRDRDFFSPLVLDSGQLNGELVEVKVGKDSRYFDPATLYCPFGLLPWEETAAKGVELRADESGFVNTPGPKSGDAVIERKATLQMTADGGIEGKVQVNFVGHEALTRRLINRDVDEAGRRKYLEDEIKGWLPSGTTAELAGDPNWWKPEEPLHTEFNVKIPSLGTATGRRLLLTPTIFEAGGTYPFKSEKRVHPVYFHFPYQEVDVITLQVPQGYQVESLPNPRTLAVAFGSYDVSYQSKGGEVHVGRRLVIEGDYFPVKYYSALRNFFDNARTSDEQQLVLKTAESAQGN